MSLRQSQTCEANAPGNQAPVDTSDQPKLNGQRSIVKDKSVEVDFMANGLNPQHEMRSDIDIDISAFTPGAALQEICAINDSLVEKCKEDTKWWECGAAEYRRRRANAETPFPPAVTLSDTSEISVESSKHPHDIVCRVFQPGPSISGPMGVLYHIHGGGWVLGSSAGQDLLLNNIAKTCRVVVVSVDYRLAPENPFPAAQEDCYDVAHWLVANGEKTWGCKLRFIMGESAGATLCASVLLHLRDTAAPCTIDGAILNYGCFDLSMTPSVRALDPDRPLVLSLDDVVHFMDAYLPGMSLEQRKDPSVSPAYNRLHNLPPALFIVGTEDGLTDDTILMSGRWCLAGNEAIVKFVPGAPHGFMTFDASKSATVKQGWQMVVQYIESKL